MAFDFPSSPSEGQIFNAPGGPSYVFNTPVWKAVGQGQIAIISDTPPASPANGALWYESDSGVLYIWYNDGNSSQWVQVGGVATGPNVVQTIVTTSGTYTKPVGLRYLEISCWGGGGAGGCQAITAAGQTMASSGGNGGAKAYSFLPAAAIGATETMVIGVGGVGTTGAGGAGTATSFGVLVSAAGGLGAPAGGASALALAFGGLGATAQSTAGQILGSTIEGTRGITGVSANTNCGGWGGDTEWGGAGAGMQSTGAGGGGTPAKPNTGSGGGGGAAGASQGAARVGGDGGSGMILLREYF
jgi:hypothetical protein